MFSGLTISNHRGAKSFALTSATGVSITPRAGGRIARINASGVVNRKTPIIVDVTDPTVTLAEGILTVDGTTPGGDPLTVALVLG